MSTSSRSTASDGVGGGKSTSTSSINLTTADLDLRVLNLEDSSLAGPTTGTGNGGHAATGGGGGGKSTTTSSINLKDSSLAGPTTCDGGHAGSGSGGKSTSTSSINLTTADLSALQTLCDVTLEVGGELFLAHMVILACRSPVFKEQLIGPTMERKNVMPHIRIDDIEPMVFRALLHFIYTDSLPDNSRCDKLRMAKDLLAAADKYHLEKLKLICEKMLNGCVDASTVAAFLGFAEKHGCKELKETCFNFIKVPGNLRKFIESDGFEGFARTCPSLLKELFLGTLDA